jgi:xanthine dehydrogenase YagS FAD-binding subunit
MVHAFAYVRPSSVDEAVRQLAAEDAHAHAGGTDLLGCLRDEVFVARKVVSLSGCSELKGITGLGDGGVRIGALSSLAEVAANPIIRERYPVLAQAAGAVASPQLRNQGTLGGNLCQRPRCWYFRGEFHCRRKGGDTCYAIAGENQFHCILGGARCYIVHPSDTAPALISLGAALRIQGPHETRTVDLGDFYVLPETDVQRETELQRGEIVTEIVVPAPVPGLRSTYRKVRERGSWDFALAGVAAAVAVDGGITREARIVLSGAAPTPWRSLPAERVLRGRRFDAETCRRAAAAAMDEAQPLGHNAYKVPLFTGVIEEALRSLVR